MSPDCLGPPGAFEMRLGRYCPSELCERIVRANFGSEFWERIVRAIRASEFWERILGANFVLFVHCEDASEFQERFFCCYLQDLGRLTLEKVGMEGQAGGTDR